ncbi:MAG: MFS transporter [Anaerolineales bacterium]|jgi:DHA3 family tetracycline resistance protein-like MFS transporter
MTDHRRAQWIYLLMAFADGVVGKVTFTMSAIYRVDVVGLDVLQLVLLGTVLETAVFLFEIPTGVIADVYSRRLSVIIGIGVMGVGFILEGVFPVFISVLVAQVVWGIGWTFVSGARSAWITDEVGLERAGKLFLIDRQVLQVGSLIGIALAVPLANLSLRMPYFIGGGLFLLMTLILTAFMPETGFQPRPKEERQGWRDMLDTMQDGVTMVRSRTALLWYALIALFVGLYSEGWDRLKEPQLLTNHTFPDLFGISMGAIEWFAVLSITSNLLSIGANQIARRRMDTGNTRVLARALQTLYLIMVISMAGFSLSKSFWLAIGFMLGFDMLREVIRPLTLAFVNHYVDSKVRATVLSMAGQIDALGQLSGGPVIGFVGRMTSIPVAIITSAAILFPTVPLFGLLLRSDKKEDNG